MIVAAFGVIVTISGIALGIVVGRRQFNRRNENGIEIFSSYSAMRGSRLLGAMHRYTSSIASPPVESNTSVDEAPIANGSEAVKIGYMCVSRGDRQDLAAQDAALRAAGCERLFNDKASGAK